MKVIFMGTPEFSVPALQKLLQTPEIEVVAVYTRAPAPAKRGKKILRSPVHELALEHNIEVLTPKSLKSEEAQRQFAQFEADAALVVAYGLILPENIIKSTKFGCVNIHPSILPKWRGATPMQSSLWAGDEKVGVCVILMDEGVDSGDIIAQKSFLIGDEDNFANLAPRMAAIGSNLAVGALFFLEGRGVHDFKNAAVGADMEALEGVEFGLVKQDHGAASFSKKIAKEDARIDFSRSAREVLNQIRALSGFLTAFFEFRGERVRVFEAEIAEGEFAGAVGEVLEGMVIKCGEGAVRPLVLQRAGKGKVGLADFLRGLR